VLGLHVHACTAAVRRAERHAGAVRPGRQPAGEPSRQERGRDRFTLDLDGDMGADTPPSRRAGGLRSGVDLR
jgi:hypothetical protein